MCPCEKMREIERKKERTRKKETANGSMIQTREDQGEKIDLLLLFETFRLSFPFSLSPFGVVVGAIGRSHNLMERDREGRDRNKIGFFILSFLSLSLSFSLSLSLYPLFFVFMRIRRKKMLSPSCWKRVRRERV